MKNNMEVDLNQLADKENNIGVSLLEALIVMAIVSILSHLSLSAYQHFTSQRQLVHNVRETIAFLAYQQQQALLYHTKIKIFLLLSPINQITALPLHLRYSSEEKDIFSLSSGVELTHSTTSYFTFGDLRQTLKPMSFILKSVEGEVKIIISSLGRIRACSQQVKVFSPC